MPWVLVDDGVADGVAESEWQTHLDKETNRWYYYHSVTGETQWVE